MRGPVIAAVLWLVLASPAAAQLAPGIGQKCGIDVAFEPLGVREAITQQRLSYHAIVLVSVDAGRAWRTAFEANPSGGPPTWGYLIGRERNLAARPLKAGTLVRTAGRPGMQTCARLIDQLLALVADLNRSRVRYNPTPALSINGANSNSFTHWAVRKLNLVPPPAPSGTYGYYANLQD
ncbi:MAG: hypothetical protein AB7O88_19850 [Reyranellaceae bacterium]